MTNIALRAIKGDDCRDIWLWRNHLKIRKNFFNPEPVSWQMHKEWFNSKIKDLSAKMYIAIQSEGKIGVIRFEIEANCVKVSVNLNPDFLGKGLGSRLIKAGTEKFYGETSVKKPIIAEIKKNNVASQKAFAKGGYRFKEDVEEKIIYCMEF